MPSASPRRRHLAVAVACTLVGGALALLPTPAPAGAASEPGAVERTVAGYSGARADDNWGLYESCLDTTRGFLGDETAFGPSGTVRASFTIADGIDVATPEALAGVHIFFTGWVDSTTYTPEEKDALLDFVLGGGAMVATTDAPDHDMTDIFGMTLEFPNLADGTATVTDGSSPLADGPFGTVTDFVQGGDYGWWSDLGPAEEVGANADGPTLAVIPAGALGTGSGPVVLVADVDVFSDCYGAPDVNALQNETLIKNIFAWLVTEGNRAPVLVDPADDQEIPVGSESTVTGPAFRDPDGDVLTVDACCLGGSVGQTLSDDGTVNLSFLTTPTAAGTETVDVTATDLLGASVSDQFEVTAVTAATTTTTTTAPAPAVPTPVATPTPLTPAYTG